jgi:hypothetical protein
LDLHPGLMQIERGAIGAVMGGGDDDAVADFDAVAVEIIARRIGQHDAGAVVVGKHQRPLDRAGGEHHLFRPHLPQPLARRIRIGAGE